MNASDGKIISLTEQLALIRKDAKDARRSRRRKCKLDKYRDDILFLHNEGASLSEIRAWAKRNGCSVARTTVFNALRRWLPT